MGEPVKLGQESEFDRGWKAGMLEAEALLVKRADESESKLKGHIEALLGVIKWAQDHGCLDHTDCATDYKESFYLPIKKAKRALKGGVEPGEDDDDEDDDDY